MPFDLAFQSFADELASLPGDYIAPDGLLLLALVDGLPVGCVALHRWDDRHAEIKRLYVQPTCRGLGVGRALVGEVLAAARAAGYRAVLLDTTPTMVEAQQLYRSVGFVDTASYRHNPVPGTRYLRLEFSSEAN